jgi:hypothetical protein
MTYKPILHLKWRKEMSEKCEYKPGDLAELPDGSEVEILKTARAQYQVRLEAGPDVMVCRKGAILKTDTLWVPEGNIEPRTLMPSIKTWINTFFPRRNGRWC